MKKIIEFLQENGIEYTVSKFGNPYYFDDNFSVEGLQVSFDFYLDDNASSKKAKFEKFIKFKKSYEVRSFRFGCGYTYNIFTVFDARRLDEHENAIKKATEKFWQEEHARRLMAGKAI